MPGLRLGGSIGGLVGIQLVAAFAVQLVVLRVVGAGRETDAFIGAQTLPLLAASIVGTSLQNIWQPRLATATPSHRRIELEAALAMTCAIVVPVAAVLTILSSPIVRVLFVGFSWDQRELTVELMRVGLLGVVFNILALILAASGRAAGRFVAVEAIPTAMSLLAFAGMIVLVPVMGVRGATWILTTRAILAFFVTWVMLGRPLPRCCGDVPLASTARGVFALMGGSSFYKLGPLVDRYWGSQAPTGQLTLYNLAQSGMGAAATLLERAIALPIVPQLSRSIHADDYATVRRLYRRALVRIWVTVLLCGVTGILATTVVRSLIAEVLHMSPGQVGFLELLGLALLGFLGVAAGGAVINSTFYSMNDVRTPISVGTVGFFLGLIVKTVAFLSSGLVAMAAATSLYYIATMVVMVAILERRLNEFESARHRDGI